MTRATIESAFAKLPSNIAARPNFMCCGTCGHYALSTTEQHEQYIFWHEQADERSFDTRDLLVDTLYLQHQLNNPAEVVETMRGLFQNTGITVEWDGKQTSCIALVPMGTDEVDFAGEDEDDSSWVDERDYDDEN